MPAVSITGWVLTVRLSSSAGPCSTSFHRSWPIASDACEKVSRTPGSWAKDFIMPTDCEPCPGKTKAIFMISRLPAQQYCAPGKASAHGFEQQRLTRMNAAVACRLVQRERNGCRRRVSVMVHRRNQFFFWQAKSFRRRLHDPDVGLMRDEPIEIRHRQAGGLQHFVGSFFEYAHRKFEYGTAIHVNERRTPHLPSVHAAGHTEHFLVPAVGVQFRSKNPWFLARCDYHRSGPITEQNAGTAIAPVEDARIHLCTHHQYVLGLARADEQIGDRQCVDKTTANGLHVERRTTRNAEFRLQNTGGAGKYDVRRRRSDNNEIDVCGVHFR